MKIQDCGPDKHRPEVDPVEDVVQGKELSPAQKPERKPVGTTLKQDDKIVHWNCC